MPKLFDFGFELFDASCSGDAARVQELLDQGADPLATTTVEAGFDYDDGFRASHFDNAGAINRFQGFTALMAACARGHLPVIKLLASAQGLALRAIDDADDKRSWTPLAFAARAGHADCVEFLLENGADPWPDPDEPPILTLASLSSRENLEAMGALLAARPDAALAFHKDRGRLASWVVACAASGRANHMIFALANTPQSALHLLNPSGMAQREAVFSGNIETLRLTLPWMEPAPSAPGAPNLFMHACQAGRLDMAQELLPWFDPHERIPPSTRSNAPFQGELSCGFNALGFAASHWTDCSQLIDWLVHLGVDAGPSGDKGLTPLMIACGARDDLLGSSARPFNALALLPLGFIDAQDRQGNTAAMSAFLISFRRAGIWANEKNPHILEMIQALCEASDLDVTNHEGLTLPNMVEQALEKNPNSLIALRAQAALQARDIDSFTRQATPSKNPSRAL